MRAARTVLLACTAVLVHAQLKVESSAAVQDSSSGLKSGQSHLTPSQAGLLASQLQQPNSAIDINREQSRPVFITSEADDASASHQPRFGVPDNGEPVGLQVRPGSRQGGDQRRAAERRLDGPPAGPAGSAAASAVPRTDSYGLLSGRDSAEGVTLPPGDAKLSAPNSGGPGGGGDARGRLLSLIDGVYQQTLDADADTTYITPLDGSGHEPFELSVSRYGRFVEAQERRHGEEHKEEDLENLLQRLKGKLGPEESVDGPAGGPAVGLTVDPGLTERGLLPDAQAAEAVDSEGLVNRQESLLTVAEKNNELLRRRAERQEETVIEDGKEQTSTYVPSRETTENADGIERIIFGRIEETAPIETVSTETDEDAHEFHEISHPKAREKLVQTPVKQATLDSLAADYFYVSDEDKSRIGDNASHKKTLKLSNADKVSKKHISVHKTKNAKSNKLAHNFQQISATLEPPPGSHSEQESLNSQSPLASRRDPGDQQDNSATTELLKISDDDTERRPESDFFLPENGVKQPRRLPEYRTHAEISISPGPEAADPAADGYGPVKPCSVYVPSKDADIKAVVNTSGDADDNEPDRGVTPRSLDDTQSPTSQSSDLAQPRLIEPWEPPKQRPRIKIHLPFVQKETIVQFHPADRHRYGPPKAIYSTSSDPASDGGHPIRHGSVSGTIERPRSADHRPPSAVPADEHTAAGSPLPSHLLPKEHRVTSHRPGPVHTSSKPEHRPPVHSSPRPNYQPPIHTSPAPDYHPPVHTSPQTDYQPPVHVIPAPDYHLPVHSSPKPGYHPPVHSSPTPDYHPPVHSSPTPDYHPPVHSSPTPDYHPPVHSSPKPDYHPPVHSSPKPHYHPSVHTSPKPDYHPPVHSSPKPDYHPPVHSSPKPDYHPPVHSSPKPDYHPPVHSSPKPDYHPPVHSSPKPDYHQPVHPSPQQDYNAPVYQQQPPQDDPQPLQRPPPAHPAWLDVPQEVLPLAEPPQTPTESPYDPVRITTHAPTFFPPKPIYTTTAQPYSDASAHAGGLSSYAQVGHFPTPPRPTLSPAEHTYVSPIPLNDPPTPSYVLPKLTPSYTAPAHPPRETEYHPVGLPHVEPNSAVPAYSGPLPLNTHPSQRPALSAAGPSVHQPGSAVYPVTGRPPPSAAPQHRQPLKTESAPAVIAPVRNYVVPSVDKLAKRPRPRAPAGSPVRKYVTPSQDELAHRPRLPTAQPPHLASDSQPIRNYVAASTEKLTQSPRPPGLHPPHPTLTSQPIRNYVPPPKDKLVQEPRPSAVHPPHPASNSHPIRNYKAPPKDKLVQSPRPPALSIHPPHPTSDGRPIRNYEPPPKEKFVQRPQPQASQPPHPTPTAHPIRNYVAPSKDKLVQSPRPPAVHSPHPAPASQSVRNYQAPPRAVRGGAGRGTAWRDGADRRPVEPVQSSAGGPSLKQPQQANSADGRHPRQPQEETSIVGVLEASGSKLLLKLLKLSGFQQLLEDTGPYTLFAPTEEALKELLDRLGGLDTILDSMGKESLLKLLQYHVLRGYALLEDLENDLLGKTLEGSRLRINRYDTYNNRYGRSNVTTVNGERLVKADLTAANGLVHFIDGVLAPPPADVVQALQRDPLARFTVLTEALKLAGLQNLLTDHQGGPVTLFAPTNIAFTQLPAEQLRRLLRDRRRLRQLLLGHVIGGTVYSAGLQPFQEVNTLADTTVRVFSDTVSVKVDNSLVLVPDVTAANGVVHAIDALLGLEEH